MRLTSLRGFTSPKSALKRWRFGFMLFVALALVSVLGLARLDAALPLPLDAAAQAPAASLAMANAPLGAGASLQGSATVLVSPINTTVNNGGSFTVVVRCVAGTDRVDASEVHLSFNKDLLAVEGITYGTALNSPIGSGFNNAAGTVTYIAARLTTPASSVTGTFDLFTLQFRAKQPAASTNLALGTVYVLLAGENHSVSKQSGTVTILAPTNTPTPSITPTPTQTPLTTAVPTPTRTPTRAGDVQEIILQQGLDGYQGFEDTFINDWDRERNYHLEWNVDLRSPHTKRTLIKADVSMLTPGTIIEEAILTLCLAEDSSAPIYAQIFQMLAEWNGRETTWLERKAKVPWGAMGANEIGVDRGAAIVFERRIFPTSGSYPNYPFDFDVTGLVQSWVNAPLTNQGLMINSDTIVSSEFRFRASDYNDIRYRPKLTIRFREGDPFTPTPTPTGSVTVTPTPSETPTPTPSVTPTQTPAYGELAGHAFLDANGNGIFDTDEQTVQGVVLDLRGMSGVVYNGIRVTDMDGYYLFSMLDPGQYELTVSSVPQPYRLAGHKTYAMYISAGAVIEINIPLREGAMLALPLVLNP